MDKKDIAKAQANAHLLVDVFNMSEREFEARGKDFQKQNWWDILGTSQPPCILEGGTVQKKLSSLRAIFRLSPYLQKANTLWIPLLLNEGKVQCICCSSDNNKFGILSATKQVVTNHLKNEDPHGKMSRALAARTAAVQLRIDAIPAGVGAAGPAIVDRLMSRKHRESALVVGSFVAGGHGAAGVPPSAIPSLLNKNMLGLLQAMSRGIPSVGTIFEKTLPDAVTLVEERVREKIRDKPISLYIDGGNASNLAYGRKVVVVCAGNMELGDTVLLDVMVLEAHESSDTQVEQIKRVVEKYGVEPKNVHYMCADNASPNKLTVEKLNQLKGEGWNIIYARCLPHCLNLIVRAFMNVLDKEFKFSSNLKLMRQLLTAGGGVGRKLLALEFGFTISGVDFSDVRWASLTYAICYVANKQDPKHLEAAKKRLQMLADNGDATAKEALDNPGDPRVVFNVLYDMVDSVSEEALSKRKEDDDVAANEASLPVAKKRLLKYFSQPMNYLGFQLVDIVLGGDVGDKTERLASLFSITQGSPKYAARLKSSVTGEVPNAVNATQNLLSRLKGLHYPWTGAEADENTGTPEEQVQKRNIMHRLGRVFATLKGRAAEQAQAVVDNCKANEHDILDATKDFDQDNADSWKAEQAQLYINKFEPKLRAILAEASEAVAEAAGLEKTEECIDGLKWSQVFDMNQQPVSFGDDERVLRHLRFEHDEFPVVDEVLDHWRDYVHQWRPPATTMSPPEVYAAWKAKLNEWPHLAKHAMRCYSRPMSAAACERMFSYLEDMNSADRARMESKTLAILLYLRGNWEIFEELVQEENDARIEAQAEAARVAGGKRPRPGGAGGL